MVSIQRAYVSCLTLFYFTSHVPLNISTEIEALFRICYEKTVTVDIVATTYARSKIGCARKCAGDPDCLSASYRHGISIDNCNLSSYTDNDKTCGSYPTDSESCVLYAVEKCLNGGTFVNGSCVCLNGFNGESCQNKGCSGDATYDADTGVCYRFGTTLLNFVDSKAACAAVPGGHLISSDLTLNLLLKLHEDIAASPVLSAASHIYIDGNGLSGVWHAWNGDALVYDGSLWASNQPNSPISSGYCIFMAAGQSFYLNDLNCGTTAYQVCQEVP